MAEGSYLIGIDGGTESVRVGIFDREGTPLIFSSEEYATEHPRPGWAEQDPDEWWSRLVAAVKGAMDESGVSPEEIAGISLDCTSCTVVALDERDHHLRPAILWMDVRAADQARRIGETGEPLRGRRARRPPGEVPQRRAGPGQVGRRAQQGSGGGDGPPARHPRSSRGSGRLHGHNRAKRAGAR